jgi:anti-sigma regulatory factor (Ser/Thr protein kinase)
MSAPGRLELTLPPAPSSVAEARTRVLDALSAQVADGKLDTVRLLVSEVVTNAVRHGGAEDSVRVRASWNSEIRIEVVDRGHGFTPAPRPGELEQPGGFGLFLVGRLADRWGVETNDTTTVWFVLRNDG